MTMEIKKRYYEENPLKFKSFLPISQDLFNLDVCFFRKYKIVIRRLEEYFRNTIIIIIDIVPEKPHRLFTVKLHFVVYHQFHPLVLKSMPTYAWVKYGYVTDNEVRRFVNVLQPLLLIENGIYKCSKL